MKLKKKEGIKKVRITHNKTLFWIIIVLIILLIALVIYIVNMDDSKNSQAGLANPASVYCQENGGVIEIMSDERGQFGICILENGTRCDEWKYYQGSC